MEYHTFVSNSMNVIGLPSFIIGVLGIPKRTQVHWILFAVGAVLTIVGNLIRQGYLLNEVEEITALLLVVLVLYAAWLSTSNDKVKSRIGNILLLVAVVLIALALAGFAMSITNEEAQPIATIPTSMRTSGSDLPYGTIAIGFGILGTILALITIRMNHSAKKVAIGLFTVLILLFAAFLGAIILFLVN